MVDRRMPPPHICGKTVLDVGSGARPFGNIQVDLPPEESDKHHQGKSVMPTMFADAHNLPLRGGVVDRVLLLHIIEHLEAPLYALRDVRRVLKPFGSVRIEIPNPQKWAHERKEHLYSWHPDTFHNIVRVAGFIRPQYHADTRNHSIEAVK